MGATFSQFLSDYFSFNSSSYISFEESDSDFEVDDSEIVSWDSEFEEYSDSGSYASADEDFSATEDYDSDF